MPTAGLTDAPLVLRRAARSAGSCDRRYRHEMASNRGTDRDERASAVPPQGPSEGEDLTIEMLDLLREECLGLLASHSFGRLAVSMGERACAASGQLPVRRAVAVGGVPDRGRLGVPRRGAVSRGHIRDRRRRGALTGWSVIISGVADEVTDPNEISRLDGLDLAPPRSEWVAVRGGWEAAGLLGPR